MLQIKHSHRSSPQRSKGAKVAVRQTSLEFKPAAQTMHLQLVIQPVWTSNSKTNGLFHMKSKEPRSQWIFRNHERLFELHTEGVKQQESNSKTIGLDFRQQSEGAIYRSGMPAWFRKALFEVQCARKSLYM